jgi:hypothetical protein
MRKATKPKYTYRVYVIELGGNPNHVYVGQSYLTAQERLHQHRHGYKSAPSIKKVKRMKLRPDLYAYLGRFTKRKEAEKMEELLARDLREEGFKVEGGH